MSPPIRLLGVDLATTTDATGLLAIDLDGEGGVEILTKADLRKRAAPDDPAAASDPGIVRLVKAPDRICLAGIDAPFGWPKIFADQVHRWSEGQAWDYWPYKETNRLMRFRATDRFVQNVGEQAQHEDGDNHRDWPDGISVSSDKLSATSRRCAGLLTLLDASSVGHRTGAAGNVIEVYPAAALAQWCLPSRGYKSSSSNSRKIRSDIIDGLQSHGRASGTQWGDSLAAEIERCRSKFETNDDTLDALVCALVVWAWRVGQTYGHADPDSLKVLKDIEQAEHIGVEGWIQHPKTDLSMILEAHPSKNLRPPAKAWAPPPPTVSRPASEGAPLARGSDRSSQSHRPGKRRH